MAGRSKFHNTGYRQYFKPTNQLRHAELNEQITYWVPRFYAAIALILYDKYKWEGDQISECFAESEQLWFRSVAEGWDILKNCHECTGIDVMHYRQTGYITFDGGEKK